MRAEAQLPDTSGISSSETTNLEIKPEKLSHRKIMETYGSLPVLAKRLGLPGWKGISGASVTFFNILKEDSVPLSAFIEPGTKKCPIDLVLLVYPKESEGDIAAYIKHNKVRLGSLLEERRDVEPIGAVRLNKRPRHYTYSQISCLAGSWDNRIFKYGITEIIEGIEDALGVRFLRYRYNERIGYFLEETEVPQVVEFLKSLGTKK